MTPAYNSEKKERFTPFLLSPKELPDEGTSPLSFAEA